MSTFAPPKPTSTVPALRPTLRQPLARLQAGIRRYVFLDGLAIAIIVVFLWGLASLLFDWGLLFQLFHVDYVHDGAATIRAFIRGFFFVLLAGTAGWVLVSYLLLRLAKPLTAPELALVLERKYGRQLGDRLVTAVELDDERSAEAQGYSWSMVQATTREAEERLQGLSVHDALDSRRLVKRLLLAGACLVSILLGFIFVPEVTATWAERNLLLRKIPWPKPLLLEIADFPNRYKAVPFGSELKVTVRSAKWAVADRQAPEGWRPLQWADILPDPPIHIWEFDEIPMGARGERLYQALPATWRSVTLDQVESKLQSTTAQLHQELGRYLIQECLKAIEETGSLPAELAALLPPGGSRHRPLTETRVALSAALLLSRDDAVRLLAVIPQIRPFTGDILAQLTFSPFSLPIPLPPLTALQKITYDRDRDLPAFALPESDRRLLPEAWQKLPIRDLFNRLRGFASEENAGTIGEYLVAQLQSLFSDLEWCAARTQFATRKTFRQLTVPEKITLEFENLVETDERAAGRSKRGQPELKRSPTANEFSYDFKKIERPLRLRALAGNVATPWFRLDVKPLPTLKQLAAYRDEPAYLHASLHRVLVGPITLALDGEETRADAPQGSKLWLVGESHKPLRAVRAIAENPADNPTIEHQSGDTRFTLRPPPKSTDDVRLRLEIEDLDGILASRKLVLLYTPDKPPEFLKAQFEAVNRKFITPQAILPLSVAVRDDSALLGLDYEISLQKPDRSVVHELRLPFRRFSPLKFQLPQAGGLRFEQQEDLSVSRLWAQIPMGPQGDYLTALSAVARLPAGSLTFLPPLAVGLHRDFAHDYIDRNLFGPVINIEDEFLDTLQLRSALGKPEDKPLLATPFRMVVRLSARDNRMKEDGPNPTPWHQDGKSNETFEFNVVSEQDLLIEAGRKEEDLRDRFEESIAAMTKLRSSLKRIRDDLDTPSAAKDEDVRRAISDAQDATKALAVIRNGMDEKVLREFRQVFRELALNRVDTRVLDRIDVRICRPLAFLLQPAGLFSRLEEAVDQLSRRLDAERQSTPKSVIAEPLELSNQVLAELDKILQDMKKLIEFNEALRVLRELISNEQKLIDEVKALIEKKLKDNLDDK